MNGFKNEPFRKFIDVNILKIDLVSAVKSSKKFIENGKRALSHINTLIKHVFLLFYPHELLMSFELFKQVLVYWALKDELSSKQSNIHYLNQFFWQLVETLTIFSSKMQFMFFNFGRKILASYALESGPKIIHWQPFAYAQKRTIELADFHPKILRQKMY